jgi:serine/threonine protein kinase/Tol biopolymer transport system component
VELKLKDIEAIYHGALEKEAGRERAAYLDSACGNNAALREHIEALLKANEDAGNFLDTPPADVGAALDDAPLTERPGTVIGRYKLLEKIGEGGMAVVYMAEQQEPIRRKVALKIIKLGMDTKSVIARFEAERQALALMDHPNIAKVLDAGATETGRPYFVMELVKGVSITGYCDANSLSTKERLELFIQVCNAVQHAHQKGIIHRDIKPTNVMVTLHDGKPVPKVIDFGIAKAINQKLTEKTLFTRYAHIIGTPAYMSPEQAELSDLDIDTRTDIYSLGVLLYELLTGTPPFGEEELRKAGYIEMQRVIREQEPAKPSTKLSTLGKTLTDIAKLRSATPEVLTRAVRGDLDWIVMKSLEKDRARRYETANGLALDLRRHLEHEPVVARGPSTTYRLQKFLRRHRSQTVAALAIAAVAGSMIVILSMWNRDRLQLAEAEGFRHRGILSQAREQYARADREAALETIKPILDSRHIGPEAQLLYAGILVDNRRSDEAVSILNSLLNDRPEIAGAAHSLLARILWESESPNAETIKEIDDHRQKAQALLPETAEAYFLHAMTGAITVKEQFTALDRAVQLASLDKDLLNPVHYESRRLRAFTYYASRKYEEMKDDALFMVALRPRDPLGYSLRAVALRELSKYAEAIAEYDNAIALTLRDNPQYMDLRAQRNEVFLRMGDYERVVADAQELLKLSPEKPASVAGILPAIRGRDAFDTSLRYYIFSALTALGDYDKADAIFRQIVSRTPTSRNEFREWVTKYVFDTLEAGRYWHPPDREPESAAVSLASRPRSEGGSVRSVPVRAYSSERLTASLQTGEPAGAAFLPMVEAEETYRALSAKARRLTTDGFSAQWSPDGKKLAFSAGVHGYSGVAIYDPAMKETELLIVPGKDPRWSPDGRYIAFVRDCQLLRLEELAAAERKDQERRLADEEVWIMNADGTEPRRLALGGWPSWSKDSTCVYYHSRVDQTLCSISLVGQDIEAKRITSCPSYRPSVSPDNQRVAYVEDMLLIKVKDLASQTVVAQWRVPFDTWGGPAWSPTGQELCLGVAGSVGDRTGLWIYPVDSNEPVKVLDSQLMAASWAPDGTKLVFGLRPPYFELWTADLDPNVSTIEALGPAQTLDEHWQEMLRLYTRRMQADPQDASAYADRARYYDYLHDREKANADLRRWSAIISGKSPSDFQDATPRNIRRVINVPFNCQFVFSAERPVNETPILSIAFGQKGRCHMKSFQIPMLSMSLLGLCLLSGLDAPPARADFTFGTPVNVQSDFASLNPATEYITCFSTDGLEVYFSPAVAPLRSGGQGGADLWVLKRASVADAWGPAENLGPIVNTASNDWGASITVDGLELYFYSNRPGGYGNADNYVTRRATRGSPWGPATNLGPKVNGSFPDQWPMVSPDGLELYVCSTRAGGLGGPDIYVSKRATPQDPWGDPVNLGPAVNSPAGEVITRLSPDGLLLFFSSDRPGGFGKYGEGYVARRASLSAPWQPAVNLGPIVNATTFNWPIVSPDGSALYLLWDPNDDMSNWTHKAPILPVCDFNADGKVDIADVFIMLEHWLTDYSLCDIGPYAWGDGIVDAQDLIVLAEHMANNPADVNDVNNVQ